MIIQTQILDHQQLLAFDLLNAECKRIDGNVVASYRHLLGADRARPANILYYDGSQLVGFLAAFFFTDKACEIALMVDPSYRRKGIATQLLKRILTLLHIEGVNTVIFSSPQGLNDAWLLTYGLDYQNCEYQMQRHINERLLLENSNNIRLANHSDIPYLCAIDEVCFPELVVQDMPAQFTKRLHDPKQQIFVVTSNEGIPIGKAHFTVLSESARLTDIAVLPRYQGRGLASVLVAHCVNFACDEMIPILYLDVESANQHACNLYTRLGFAINNGHDYWQITQFGLTDFLQRT